MVIPCQAGQHQRKLNHNKPEGQGAIKRLALHLACILAQHMIE